MSLVPYTAQLDLLFDTTVLDIPNPATDCTVDPRITATDASFTFLPQTWTVSAYHSVFTEFNFGRYMLNSFVVAAAVTVSNVFLASLGFWGGLGHCR